MNTHRGIASFRVTISISLITLSSVSCDSATGPSPDRTVAVEVITPAGGSFSLLDGTVLLDVPAGAVPANTRITVTALTEGTAFEGAVPGTVYKFEPDGLEFDLPVTLTLAYDRGALPDGVDVDLLRVHRFVDGVPQLIVGSRLDISAATATATLRGFSFYAIVSGAIDALLDGVIQMWHEAETAQDEALNDLLETIHQDLAVLIPRVENDCRATPKLSEKKRLLDQLLVMQKQAELLPTHDLVMVTHEICGGLLDPKQRKLLIEPSGDIRLWPGEDVQLIARMFGPGDQALEGKIVWLSMDPSVASVSDGGLVTGETIGKTVVAAESADILELIGTTHVLVAPDLLVELTPPELVLPMGRPGQLIGTVRDPETSELQDLDMEWSIADEAVATLEESTVRGAADVTPLARGTTTAEACVEGLDESSCGGGVVRVVYNVQGTWSYQETLAVDVDLPARETCQVEGTMTIEQVGDTYSGTARETAVCTFDPGDGSLPTAVTMVADGEIRNGKITDDTFYHEGVFVSPTANDEACRVRGTMQSLPGEDGFAVETTGTVECLDEMDFYSTGPSRGTWVKGPR